MEHNGVFQYHTECFDQDDCCSSDGLAVYLNEDDEGDEYLTGHCYACDQFFGPKYFQDNDIKHREKRVSKKETKKLDPDLHEYIQGLESTGSKVRKIDKKYMEMYGVKASRKDSGAVHKHYYPITIDNSVAGYKVRELPKKFNAVGETSPSKVQFFGQSVFESGKVIASDKFLIITEGECFPYDAEVFTENGWVKLGEYRGGSVLQYNEDGSANFTKPVAYIEKAGSHDLVTHKVEGFTSTTTLGHNMVVQTAEGVLRKVSAQDFPVNTTDKIIRTFNIESSGINLTDDQLRFCAAISDDFKFDQISSGATHAHAVMFKKDSKNLRIRKVLSRCGISYTSYQQKGDYSDYTIFNIYDLPDWCPKGILPNAWLAEATQHQRNIIMEEMVDDRVPNSNQVEYSSKYYENAVWMQTLAHSMGYCSSTIPRKNEFGSWSVVFKKKHTSTQSVNTSYEKTENGVYCVKVDSGMLVVRQNDQIHISGNCDAVATQQVLSEQGNPNFTNAVVSIPNGTGSAVKTLQTNWKWVQKFDHVILFFDQDEPGRESAIEVAKKLPLGKCKIAKFSEKDPCDMLKNGKEKELYEAMWRAETYAPDGVLPGESLWDMVNTPLAQSDAHYPWSGLDAMLHGIRTSEMVTLTAGCVDMDTEFLTPTGWKRISDYQVGDQVAQYHESGEISYKEPLHYHKYGSDNLWKIKTKYGVDQVLSDEHNVVYLTDKGNLATKQLSELKDMHEKSKQGFGGRFLTTFNAPETSGIPLTDDEIRLTVVSGGFRSGTNYTQLCTKTFDQFWWNASDHQLKVICDEVLYWGGNQKNQFYSADKEDIDFLQYAFATQGKRTTVHTDDRDSRMTDRPCYTLQVAGNNTVGIKSGASEKVGFEEYKPIDGFKYCFTTETGMWVMRRNNRIVVTCNSGVAKSTFARTIAHHLQKTVDDNIGMIFLEESVKKTSLQIMSLEAGKQLHLPETQVSDEDKRNAFDKTLGTGKYYFYDDFASQDFDGIVESIEYMARAANCKYIFLDHISMLVSGGVDGDERRALDAICTKLRSLTQQLDITLVIVTHLKRPPGVPHENGGETNLAQLRGTAGIAQLSDIVIGFERNSQADDHMEKNTTHVRILKNRFSGETGLACSLFYDQKTGWLRELSENEVAEMDTDNSEFDDYDVDSDEFLHDNYTDDEEDGAVVEY